MVKILIGAGADLKTPITWRGSRTGVWIIGDDATALHYAAEEGPPESAELLIDAGISVDARDTKGQTPLHIAAIFGRAAMVRFLLERGADPTAKRKDGGTAMDLSLAGRGEGETVTLLKNASEAAERRKSATPDTRPADQAPQDPSATFGS